MPAVKLTIAYDGTDLVGWQRQPGGVSVQGLLEDALTRLDGREVVVHGAGRTDAGVHALAQTAHVALQRRFEPRTIVRALNAVLPASVRVLAAEPVPAPFHARFDARAKTYRYRIWNADVLNPFERAYAWHVRAPLDAHAMDAAAARLVGQHDFAAFQGTGSQTATTTRLLYASVVKRRGSLIIYEVCGDGFLRHMVRAIAGSLVEIGRGRRFPAWMDGVLASRQRAAAGTTAPPHGLFLVRVHYAAPRLPLAAER